MPRKRQDRLPVVHGDGFIGDIGGATRFLVHPEAESADAILKAAKPVPKVIGVYCLVLEDEVVYVGVSSDVLRRLFEHRRKSKWENRPNAFDRVAVFTCQTRDEADTLESRLIKSLQPRYNATGVIRNRFPQWWHKTPSIDELAAKMEKFDAPRVEELAEKIG